MSQEKFIYDFKNQTAFITGASTGIGRATALAFAACGARVALADVNEGAGKEIKSQIENQGGEALFIKCDVSLSQDVERALQMTLERWGSLDFAFNNAGIEGASAATSEMSESEWDRVISVNLKGIWLCLRAQIPLMLKKGSGSIVNCSSIAGLVGFQGASAYVASKHGVIGLTKTAALELAKTGVRVNVVCPGVIETPMIERVTHGEAQVTKQLVQGEPMGRMGKPEEIAAAVLWLSSKQSTFVTGHALVVDGGWVAQ